MYHFFMGRPNFKLCRPYTVIIIISYFRKTMQKEKRHQVKHSIHLVIISKLLLTFIVIKLLFGLLLAYAKSQSVISEIIVKKHKSLDHTIKQNQSSEQIQGYDRIRLPEPVGPIRRMLLFSSSTTSLSMPSVLSLPEFPAGLTFQVVVTYIRTIYLYNYVLSKDGDSKHNVKTVGITIQWY